MWESTRKGGYFGGTPFLVRSHMAPATPFAESGKGFWGVAEGVEEDHTVERVGCSMSVSVTSIDPKLGTFQVRMVCAWAFRTMNPNNDTEIIYRGVPGIRIPGLSVKVQESRIWKVLEGNTNNIIKWNGTSIFLLEGFKMYQLKDFPFDRHVIHLQNLDFVWRSQKDHDDFFDSMKIVWLQVDFKSILPEWTPGQVDIEPLQRSVEENNSPLSPDSVKHEDEEAPFANKFQIDLRIERAHKFYVRQIFFVTYLITLASCSPLFMRPEDMGDRLSVYGGGLLTLVAFKYGVMDHLPSVPYSTFTDTFLLWQVVTIIMCMLESLIVYRVTGGSDQNLLDLGDWIENITFFSVVAIWTLAMMVVWCCKGMACCRKPWEEVAEKDDDPMNVPKNLPSFFSHSDFRQIASPTRLGRT
mmetsp:Transcript_23919/g.53844  ORF Transcript_23919/g.53844 Transcript_23919/m.53844 type:complete len:412 (-) Transcript_23919:100-1335(-)